MIVDRLPYTIMTLQIEILYGNNENGGLASAWMDTGYLLKDGTLFLLCGRNDFEKRKSKKYEYPQKAADFCAGH